MAETGSYKRLEFVAKSASAATGMANTVYKTTRSFTPKFVEPYVAKVEDTAASVGTPYVTFIADTGAKVLKNADDLVDYAVSRSFKVVETGKATVSTGVSRGLETTKTFHSTNLKSFSDAREKYFKYVEQSAEYVKSTLNPKPYVDSGYTALKDALAKAQTMADPDVAVDTVHQAWTSFAGLAPVKTVLTTADPVVKYSTSTYTQLHGAVVSNTYYKKAYETVGTTVAAAQSTTVYKRSVDVVYPYVKPVAEPALQKISSSKYVAAAVAHVQPVAQTVQ